MREGWQDKQAMVSIFLIFFGTIAHIDLNSTEETQVWGGKLLNVITAVSSQAN